MKGYFFDFYLIGYIILFVIVLRINIKEDERLTLSTLLLSLVCSLFSWFGILFGLIERYGDITIWKKSEK